MGICFIQGQEGEFVQPDFAGSELYFKIRNNEGDFEYFSCTAILESFPPQIANRKIDRSSIPMIEEAINEAFRVITTTATSINTTLELCG
ncbi:MAG: hypothetical protein ACRCXZ_08075 [Patescibacteria group bacterium]